MAAAMAYCTSNPAFYQHSLTSTRNQFTPVARRTSSSPSTSLCSPVSMTHIDQSSIAKAIKSDENNNNQQIENTNKTNTGKILHNIADDDDDDHDNADDIANKFPDDNYQTVTNIDEEEYLACVGLRRKTKQTIARDLYLRPLTKRLAFPVCLLPLPKCMERVRQALNIRLPFLKFLSITKDIERFCSTNADEIAASLLVSRSVAQARASSTINKSQKKRRSLKTDSPSQSSRMSRTNTSRTSISKYVNSIIQCQVVLDRLEQTTINELMQNSTEDEEDIVLISTPEQSLRKTCKADRSLPLITNKATTTSRTTVTTTTTTEKTIVKRKSTTADITNPKRAKFINNNNCTNINNQTIKMDSSSDYKRIYLKCFACSKREYVDAQVTDSDTLHSHWLEHDRELSLNIYDSEIDSILTRVVEFFNRPKQHLLEGKIKTVFILNSKEVRYQPTMNSPSSDTCIVID